jgi:mannitol/fructose-specific phosphotransferase system IIA component (Ntr-type)
MRSVINHLIQLQELTLIRDEQRSLPGGMSKLGRLNDDIDTMTDALATDVKALYSRLYKRDHIVIAPLNSGSCSMCGMRLAISMVQSVRFCRELQVCPSCTRILYDSSGAKWIGERTKRAGAERKVGIARFSSPSLMVPDLPATTREEAILTLAKIMESERFVDNAAKLTDAALARESVVSTSVGHGIAFPHVRGIEGGGLAVALGVSKQGIAFDGKDDAPCHFIFFSTIPTAVSAFYLKLIAGVSEAFRKDASRTAALEATTPEILWKSLTKATRYTVK